MSASATRHAIDEKDARMAAALDQAFGFLSSAIDTPGLLDFFPDTGEIGFREVDVHGHEFQLAVVGPETAEEARGRAWEARPSRYAPRPDAVALRRSIAGVAVDPADQVGRTLAVAGAFRATGSTKAAALDQLEAMLRSAVDAAVRAGDDAAGVRRG